MSNYTEGEKAALRHPIVRATVETTLDAVEEIIVSRMESYAAPKVPSDMNDLVADTIVRASKVTELKALRKDVAKFKKNLLNA